jgi:hypothetical protein
MHTISDATLLAYIEESLPTEHMASLEIALRNSNELQARLSELISKRESGVHSVGDIWRRHRLSCPTREELGSYLLGAMTDEKHDYIKFHIEDIGCRYCQSNLADLSESQHKEAVSARRKRYFQSSVGRLKTEG